MKIQLLADYRGVLTDEKFYTAGEHEAGPGCLLSEGQAKKLIADGRAEEIKVRRVSPKAKTKVTRRKTTRKKAAK